ncbi:MAG: peptidylprolyl isomerase [Chloroflexota bacterium]|nr:peptidylprolyl isomerase [Chloroflexota bacterium]
MDLDAIGRLAVLMLLLTCTACGPALATSVPPTSAPSPTAAAAPADPTATPAPSATPTPELPLAALVNDQPIYLADYERELAQYEVSSLARGIDPNSPEEQAYARDRVLNMMIEQVLIEQAAAETGIAISDAEVDAEMQVLTDIAGGEEALRTTLAEWGQTYEDFWQDVRGGLIGKAMTQPIADAVPATTEHVHARHIQVDTIQEAERILAQLEAGADFVTLARAYSQDHNTSESGGDLAFFPRGILMAPELEEAAFALQPGQFSGVVTTALGYHIVQVVERDLTRSVDPESLRLLQDRAVQEWIEGLWAQAMVQRFVETVP